MQSKIKTEEKLRVIQAILSGEQNLSSLLPPKHYFVMQNREGLYNIPGTDLLCNEEMLQQWLNTRRECDTVIVLKPSIGTEPLTENEDVSFAADSFVFHDIDYVEVDSAPVEIVADEIPTHKRRPLKTPVNKLQDKRLISAGRLSEYGITWGSICD